MNSNIALIGLFFLLSNSGNISTTQLLLLLALLSTENSNNWHNNCGCNPSNSPITPRSTTTTCTTRTS